MLVRDCFYISPTAPATTAGTWYGGLLPMIGMLSGSDITGDMSIGGSFYYGGGLYQGSTRGIPAADIRNGAVTESKIGERRGDGI